MVKTLKIGLLVVGTLVVVTLLTLRVTGLEPAYVDPSSEAVRQKRPDHQAGIVADRGSRP